MEPIARWHYDLRSAYKRVSLCLNTLGRRCTSMKHDGCGMADISTIERLPDESAKAYQARIEYVTMGPERSTAKVGQRLGKTKDLMDRWSSRHDWQATARAWDNQQAAALQAHAAEQYRADLADYRKRYSELGKGLWQAAAVLAARLAKEARTMDLGPGALALAANAAKTAADLEALALRVEHLLNNEPGHEQSL